MKSCFHLQKGIKKMNGKILSPLVRSDPIKEEILIDIEIIYPYLNLKPMLFVTQSVLKKPDGTISKPSPRKVFPQQKSNDFVFDPAPYIIDFGIAQAMKDPARYNKEFERVIGELFSTNCS